jgi:hypothetical protein
MRKREAMGFTPDAAGLPGAQPQQRKRHRFRYVASLRPSGPPWRARRGLIEPASSKARIPEFLPVASEPPSRSSGLSDSSRSAGHAAGNSRVWSAGRLDCATWAGHERASAELCDRAAGCAHAAPLADWPIRASAANTSNRIQGKPSMGIERPKNEDGRKSFYCTGIRGTRQMICPPEDSGRRGSGCGSIASSGRMSRWRGHCSVNPFTQTGAAKRTRRTGEGFPLLSLDSLNLSRSFRASATFQLDLPSHR